MSNTITDDDLLNALADVLRLETILPNREPGWLDVKQISDHYGITDYIMHRHLAEAVQRGEMETALVWDADKRCRVRVWRKVEQG